MDNDFNRRFPEKENGPQAGEKMLKILQHQENVNWKHTRHDFAAVRTATAKETGDHSTGVDVAAVDSRPAFSWEVMHGVTVRPGNPTPREAGTYVSTQDSVHGVQGGTIHNSQMSINIWRVNKTWWIHTEECCLAWIVVWSHDAVNYNAIESYT